MHVIQKANTATACLKYQCSNKLKNSLPDIPSGFSPTQTDTTNLNTTYNSEHRAGYHDKT